MLNQKTLEVFNNSANKIDNPQNEALEIELVVQIQAINVLIVNEIKNIPMNDLIIKNSQVAVKMRKGLMEVDAQLLDLEVFDLTNYPNTLSERNLELIVPRKIFGMAETGSKKTLVGAKFVSRDPQLCNIPSDLANGELTVKVSDIHIDFHMQVVFRILGFLTDQLLPALNPVSDESQKPVFGQLSKKQAFISVFKPFWQKMDILVENTQCSFNLGDQRRVLAYLTKLQLRNQRALNKKRLIQFPRQCKIKDLNALEGIWCDQYFLDFTELNCALVQDGTQ